MLQLYRVLSWRGVAPALERPVEIPDTGKTDQVAELAEGQMMLGNIFHGQLDPRLFETTRLYWAIRASASLRQLDDIIA